MLPEGFSLLLEVVNSVLFSRRDSAGCQWDGGGFSWTCRTEVVQKLREALRPGHDFASFQSDSPYEQAEQETQEGERWDHI